MAQKSDEEFVEQVRGNLRARRQLGVVLVAVGLLLMGFMLNLLFFRNQSLWHLVETLTSGPRPISEDEDRLRTRVIFILGLAGGTAFGKAAHLLANGIACFFPNRSQTLLVQLWDERAAARSNGSEAR